MKLEIWKRGRERGREHSGDVTSFRHQFVTAVKQESGESGHASKRHFKKGASSPLLSQIRSQVTPRGSKGKGRKEGRYESLHCRLLLPFLFFFLPLNRAWSITICLGAGRAFRFVKLWIGVQPQPQRKVHVRWEGGEKRKRRIAIISQMIGRRQRQQRRGNKEGGEEER